MEIEMIAPPMPEDVIPDRESDRLFMDLVERVDKGEFDKNNTQPATDEVLKWMVWDDQYFCYEDRWYRDDEYRARYKRAT